MGQEFYWAYIGEENKKSAGVVRNFLHLQQETKKQYDESL